MRTARRIRKGRGTDVGKARPTDSGSFSNPTVDRLINGKHRATGVPRSARGVRQRGGCRKTALGATAVIRSPKGKGQRNLPNAEHRYR